MKIYIGVVEDDQDPLKLGRVRARLIGLHTEIKTETKLEGVSTEHLPWFQRVGPPFASSMTGHGVYGDPPKPGSMIFCFFLDEKGHENGFYFGTYVGIAQSVPPTGQQGFEDPSAKWPRLDRLEKTDVSFHLDEKLAIEGESYLDVRSELEEKDQIKDVVSALDGPSFSEEPYPGKPDHRFNFSYETFPKDYESSEITERHGTVVEIDSTKEYERVSIHHRTGTYQEIRPDGSKQEKIRADHSEYVLGDQKKLIEGFQTVVIYGESYLLVKSETFEEFKASVKQEIAEELEQKIGAKKTVEVPTEVHKIGQKHNLQSESDAIKCPDYFICPMLGAPHAKINKKVFVV